MKKMTFEEIKGLLEKYNSDYKNDFYTTEFLRVDNGYDPLTELDSDGVKEQLGPIKLVSTNNDLASEILDGIEEFYGQVKIWKVYYFEKHDIYIRFDGYMVSYSGSDAEYEDMKEVSPTTKTITVYQWPHQLFLINHYN